MIPFIMQSGQQLFCYAFLRLLVLIIFKSVWVRKLIGKRGVPYNRRLGVRGSSHPCNYDAGLSLRATDINAFHIDQFLY